MRSSRTLLLRATTSAVAFVACVLPSAVAGATTPPAPTTPPPTSAPAGTPQTGDSSQITESWTLAPAASDNSSDGGNRPNLSYFVDPGATIDDAVTVYNFGTVAETFRVYATDAYNDEQGQFALLAGDQQPVDAGSWVTVAQESLTVQPGQQATFPITIKIPVDAAPGDHVGAILASSPTIGTGKAGEVLTLDRRTGTRLYIRVNGALSPNLTLADVTTAYHNALDPLGGSATVTFRIENHGNIRLSSTPTVSVAGALGLGKRTVTLPETPELLPGEDVTLTAELADVPALLVDVTKVRLVPHGSDDLADVRTQTMTFAPPISALVVLLGIVVAVLVRRARRRRSQPRPLVVSPPADRADDRERQHQPT